VRGDAVAARPPEPARVRPCIAVGVAGVARGGGAADAEGVVKKKNLSTFRMASRAGRVKVSGTTWCLNTSPSLNTTATSEVAAMSDQSLLFCAPHNKRDKSQTIEKRCSKCKVVKPIERFGTEDRRPDGRRCHCKDCGNAESRVYRKSYRQTPVYQEYSRRRTRREKLRKKYGLSVDGFNALLAAQNGCCAICGATKSPGPWPTLVVDHDHQTGAIRGLLCNPCNVALGFFRDRQDVIASALVYLQRSS
jgi:hypothetical protein